jgi:hypothetical protein
MILTIMRKTFGRVIKYSIAKQSVIILGPNQMQDLRKSFYSIFNSTNKCNLSNSCFGALYTICTMYNQQMVATLYVFSIPTEQLSVSVKFAR